MKSVVLLIVIIFIINIVNVWGATRPAIPDQFYSEVHVSVNDNNRFLVGGGIVSYDVPNNKGRQDLKLENDQHQIETIHFLERFDLNEVYELVDQKCIKEEVQGNIVSPFAWVDKAQFNGTVSFRNRVHDSWVLSFKEGSNTIEYKLLVDESDVNTPVYFTTHNVSSDKTVYDLAFTFLSFKSKEPESWVFTVPSACNSSFVANVGCSQNQVQEVVYFANSNWNCGNVACSYRVPDGSAQPGYACAEFTARSLAAGQYIGLDPHAPQSSYANYKGYNLLYVEYLSEYCQAAGFRGVSPSAGNVQAAFAIMGNGGDGAWSHACIGVGSGIDTCHNIARENHAASGSFFDGIQALWAPPGC